MNNIKWKNESYVPGLHRSENQDVLMCSLSHETTDAHT